MKKVLVLVLGILVITLSIRAVYAADFINGKDRGGDVVLGSSDSLRNLYTAGRSVLSSSKILGDLFAAGGSITITGSVEDDLTLAGGNVSISAPVGGDVRIAGGNVALSAPISGDLLLAGGTLNVAEAAKVGGDLWVAGGVVNLNAPVAGEAKVAGGEIFINSAITGPLLVHADNKLTFGSQAEVLGEITYYGRREAVVMDGAKVSTIDFKEWKGWKNRGEHQGWQALVAIALFKLMAILVATLVFLKLFRTRMDAIVSFSRERMWFNLMLGVVGVIVVPIVILLLLVSVLGVYLGITLGFLFMLVHMFAGISLVLSLGSYIEKIFAKEYVALSWKTAVFGVCALLVLSLVPIVGWLAILVLYFMNFGSVMRASRERFEV